MILALWNIFGLFVDMILFDIAAGTQMPEGFILLKEQF